MEWAAVSLLVGHYVLLSALCVFGVHRFYVTFQARRLYKQPALREEFDTLPKVTVQLPLYNEQFVAKRLIEAAAALDYPADRLQIQVLDDSTDGTSEIVADTIAALAICRVPIEHIRRTIRQGYKAGALADAMEDATGEFIAVFDADFVPKPNFLKQLIHYFHDDGIGMVQAQWDYLNRQDSFLTRLQGIMLDAHFTIEQTARHSRGMFFNFNGTAGIWRKQAIVDAGGWQADTITEDLDLSYRAQLAGWQFMYLRDTRCMSELPSEMNAFKSQQHRWTKGGIEVMLKLLPTIWRAPISWRHKLEATLHFASNLSHLLILIDSLFFLIPAIVLRQTILPYPPLWVDLLLFAFGGLSHIYFYVGAQSALGRSLRSRIWLVPALMATSIGLSRSNGCGVFEALTGQKTAFIRTPKRGEQSAAATYLARFSGGGSLLEVILGIAYSMAAAWCVYQGIFLALPFMILFAWGFLFTGLSSQRSAVA